jgi:hypothetical protein
MKWKSCWTSVCMNKYKSHDENMNSLRDKWKARRTEYRLYAKIGVYITKHN